MFKKIIEQWYKLSIKNKHLIFFTFIIIFVSWISLYALGNAYSFMDRFKGNLNSYFNINNLLVHVNQNTQHVDKYLKDMNYEDLQAYNRSKDLINEELHTVEEESNTNLEAYFLLRAIRNSLTVYFEECTSAISSRQADVENYYIYRYKAMNIISYTQSYIQQLLNNRLDEGGSFYIQLVHKAQEMKTITFVSIVFILILCVGFAVFFSNYLTKSIRKLAGISNQISKGNFDVEEIKIEFMDEVGMLARAFNKMSSSIKRMMDDLTQKSLIEKKLHEEELKNLKMQQLLKEAEFKGLQSQINPHFLFNTLNIISRVSMFEDASKTTKLIQSLSNLFRYNLGKYTNKITLAKEIEIINEYMHIQKYRFGDRIRFDIVLKADVDSINIPCFTLQPLVENAIIHGIEPKENGGTVRIKVSRKQDMIIVKVIDNGVGMSKERIDSILNCDEDNAEWHVTRIGIVNVISRLRLFYEYQDCMKIKSKQGFGTVITIIIPDRKGAEELV